MNGLSQEIYNLSPVWIQNLLVSAYGYHLYRKRYAGPVYKQAKALIERVNSMSLAEQGAYQGERLHAIVRHSRANVPYYGKLLADLGLTEQDFTEPEHVKKLPVLTKQQLLENPDDFKCRGAKPYMVQHTSGSTGTPLSLWVDEFTYKLAMALLVDHEERHGVRLGERRATFAGRMIQPIDNMKPPFSRYNRAENQRLFSAYHLNADTFAHYRRELEKFQPKEIIGYPSAIHDLASLYRRSNKTPNFQPKVIITNSETLLDWQKETIESAFNCSIKDYYGTAEYLIFAGQCEFGRYHFHPSIGISEIDNQEPNSDILATSITNFSMPILRYKLGDSVKSFQQGCACGQEANFSLEIIGRIDDVITTSDGRRIGRMDHIFKGVNGIKEAQIIQLSNNFCRIDLVKLEASISIEEHKLITNFKDRVDDMMKIEIRYIDKIERNKNGKFKAVVGINS